MLEMRRLRVNKKARRSGESGPFGRVRRAGDTERPSYAHRPAENAGGEIGEPVELARAAGQDHVSARIGSD